MRRSAGDKHVAQHSVRDNGPLGWSVWSLYGKYKPNTNSPHHLLKLTQALPTPGQTFVPPAIPSVSKTHALGGTAFTTIAMATSTSIPLD